MDDANEQVTLMDAEVGSSRVFICVRSDLRPLRCHIELTRCGDVLIVICRNDDRIARSYRIVYHECTHA
jgi:hypothetical protein